MIAYAGLIFVFFGSGLLCRSKYRKEVAIRYMITTFFVVYMFLLCFRATSVGIDTTKYIYRYFRPVRTMSWREILQYGADELGFMVFVKLVAVINNAQVFIMATALVSVIPVMILYRNESKEAAVCCAFFMISLLFEIFFSGLRQGMAVGLTVPAYYYTKQKRLIPFLLITLLAFSIHSSALMILLIYPIYHARITKKWLWAVIPAMAMVYRFNRVIFSAFFSAFGGKYFEKYSTLTHSTNQYGLLVLFVLLSAYCILVMDESKADKDDIGLRNILLLATCMQFFAPLHSIASRMNYYFILFIPIAVTRANSKCKYLFWQVAKVASWVMTAYFIYYFFFHKGDTLHIMKYAFCF